MDKSIIFIYDDGYEETYNLSAGIRYKGKRPISYATNDKLSGTELNDICSAMTCGSARCSKALYELDEMESE